MICLTSKPSWSFFVYFIQSKEEFFSEKELFKEKGEWTIEQKHKEGFLTALTMVIKKDPTTSIRKHANEFKVHEKSGRTAIKPLDYTIWGVLENKINASSNANIGSLRNAIEEEWNKMSEEFIFKACKLFQRYADSIIERKWQHIE